jgi:rubrerythrin
MNNNETKKLAEQTVKNLEASFAGESMAHMKYLYFARVARHQGDEATAALFERTAHEETSHARGHLEQLYPPDTLTPARMLELAIEGEVYEYTEMYPEFRNTALEEKNAAAVAEFDEQIEESKEHADRFVQMLARAEKRFAGLAKVEERHAHRYEDRLAALDGDGEKSAA